MALTIEQQRALARARARAKLQTKGVPEPAASVGSLEDLGKTAPGALTRGTAAVPGFLGSLQSGVDQGALWFAEKIGIPRDVAQKGLDLQASIGGRAPTGQEIAQPLVEAIRPAPDQPSPLEYQPKTQLGKYGGAILETLPSAAAGPGSWASKGITGLLSALGSETAGQATEGTALEPWARAGGALTGGVLPNIARRAVTPLPTSLRRQAHVDALRREGVPLTGGQASGRRMLQYFEDELSPSAAGNIMEQQKEQFTRAAMRRTGTASTGAGPEDLNPVFDRISNQFRTLTSRHVMVPDPQFNQDLARVAGDYVGVVQPAYRSPIVQTALDELATVVQQGGMRGPAYQELRSRLGKAAYTARSNLNAPGNAQLSHALDGIQNALDDAMERTIAVVRPDDLGAFRQARTQWGSAKTIEKAMTAPGEQTAQGLLSPSRLRTATSKEYARGRSDLTRLARAGEAVMKPLPQSGTASRATVRGLFSSLGGILAGTHSGGDLPTILAGMAAGTVVPSAIGRAVLSRPGRSYLGNQVARNLPTNARLAAMIAAIQAVQSQQQSPAGR